MSYPKSKCGIHKTADIGKSHKQVTSYKCSDVYYMILLDGVKYTKRDKLDTKLNKEHIKKNNV